MKNQLSVERQLPLAILKQLDRICARFEKAWQTEGDPPRIEDYLNEVAETDQANLFQELFQVELELLGHQETTLNPTRYYLRFPQYREQIEAILGSQVRIGSSVAGETTVASGLEQEEPLPPLLSVTPVAGSTSEEWQQVPSRIGEFEILQLLGRGGMGVVYLARHAELQRLVALKLVQERGRVSPEQLTRFRTEAMAVARLQHPNIVQIFDVGKLDDLPFLVLEYVEGLSLADWLEETPLPPSEDVARLVMTVARAVHQAHQKGIIHRDLKPANILLSGNSDDPLGSLIPKIADFGLAKDLTEAEIGRQGLTHSRSIVGTPCYMTPEQARSEKTGPFTDVFALGILLYEMLTGRPPFQAETILGTLDLICKQDPIPPRPCPRDLETICLKCLEKEPHRRYASASALADDLARFLAGEPVAARPVGPLGRAWRWSRRNPTVAGLLGTVAVVLVAGAGTASFFAYQANKRADLLQLEMDKVHQAQEREAQARKDSQWYLYSCQVCLAQRELERGRTAKAQMILNRSQKDLRAWEYGYLRNYNSRQSHVLLKGPKSPVRAAVFAADGQLITVGSDGVVRSWDVATRRGQRIRTLAGPLTQVAALSPDGQLLAVQGADGIVHVQDLKTGKRHSGSWPHTRGMQALSFSPDGKHLAGWGPRGVQIWDLKSGQITFSLADVPASVQALAFSPRGDRLAIGTNRTIKVLSLPEGGGLTGGRRGEAESKSRHQHLDGPEPKAGSSTHLDTTTVPPVREVLSLVGHSAPIQAVTFSSDGQRIFSAANDQMIKIWEARRGQDLLTLEVPKTSITKLAFSPDGNRLAASDQDGIVRIWDSQPADASWKEGLR